MRTFPVIRDLVTDVSFNYEKAKQVPVGRSSPPRDADGKRRMMQDDVERGQEFRKCIECFLCQNTCHVVRDHEDNKQAFAGPRFFLRYAELDMHPLDTNDRRKLAQDAAGLGHVQHHQVLHRGLPRGHPHHRQRDHPDEGARGRPQVRPAGLARLQDPPPRPAATRCDGPPTNRVRAAWWSRSRSAAVARTIEHSVPLVDWGLRRRARTEDPAHLRSGGDDRPGGVCDLAADRSARRRCSRRSGSGRAPAGASGSADVLDDAARRSLMVSQSMYSPRPSPGPRRRREAVGAERGGLQAAREQVAHRPRR